MPRDAQQGGVLSRARVIICKRPGDVVRSILSFTRVARDKRITSMTMDHERPTAEIRSIPQAAVFSKRKP